MKTDFLSCSSITAVGFFLSEKVEKILNDFNLMKHKFYKSELINNKKKDKYFWLHLSDPKIAQNINYKKSTFYRTEFNTIIESIEIESFEEYLFLKKKNHFSFGVKLKNLVINKNLENLDLFTILPFDNNIYISESIVKSLKERQFSGYALEEVLPNYISFSD